MSDPPTPDSLARGLARCVVESSTDVSVSTQLAAALPKVRTLRVALDVGRGMLVTTSCLLNTAAAFSSVSLLPAATSAAGLALYHAHSVGDAIIYRRENTTRISGQLLDLWDIWDMRGLEPDDQAEQIVYCPILEDTGSTATSVNKQPALGVLIAGIDETAAVEAELAKDEEGCVACLKELSLALGRMLPSCMPDFLSDVQTYFLPLATCVPTTAVESSSAARDMGGSTRRIWQNPRHQTPEELLSAVISSKRGSCMEDTIMKRADSFDSNCGGAPVLSPGPSQSTVSGGGKNRDEFAMERGLLTFKSHSVERAFVAWQAGQHHWRDFVALLLLIFTDLMWFLANSQRKQIYVATKRPLIIPPLYLTALLLFMIAPERFQRYREGVFFTLLSASSLQSVLMFDTMAASSDAGTLATPLMFIRLTFTEGLLIVPVLAMLIFRRALLFQLGLWLLCTLTYPRRMCGTGKVEPYCACVVAGMVVQFAVGSLSVCLLHRLEFRSRNMFASLHQVRPAQ